MTSFALCEGVYLVSGALRGALLDTNTGYVYSINESAVSIIKHEVDNDMYWQQLIDVSLAYMTDENVNEFQFPRLNKIELSFVWFEIISDDCNESCVHCYAESMPPAHRKALGLPGEGQSQRTKLSYDRWLGLIKEAYELGCRRCQFIGGEPFIYHDGINTVLDLAEFAHKLGYEFIEIFTNATLLTSDRIARIKRLNLNIAVSLYSNDPVVHDSITNTQGSYAKTVANLRLLKQANVRTRVETVIMRQNQDTLKNTQILIKDIGFSGKSPDPLRPKGRGDNKSIRPSQEIAAQYGYKLEPNFTAEKSKVAHYFSGHSCLAGKITITDTGDVLPCIFSRNQVIGSVTQDSIEEVILSTALQQIWNTTKDNVLVCKDCEYRYVCFDCRPLSEAAANGNADYLHAPYPRCTYNPYTGEWASGVWHVNGSGEPWYDSSMAPMLRQVASLKSFNASEGH